MEEVNEFQINKRNSGTKKQTKNLQWKGRNNG